ncbi:MAG: ATP-dependent DNA ligase [Gammaproteobacteria bacterium]|nr:ATP-dependent DNA ligase [Gammaproteobacteria bacterium]
MNLSNLAKTSARVAATRKRNEKTALLATCIAEIPPPERPMGVAYLAGELPQGKIGVGYAGVRKAMDTAPAALASLTLAGVHRSLTDIAQTRGKGANPLRQDTLATLFAKATVTEQSFLARLLLGELRQGAGASLVVDAIAKAASQDAASVRRAHMLEPDLGKVCDAAFQGVAQLGQFKLKPFAPLQPMLAQTAASIDDALTRFEHARLEWKLDGARVQVHKDGGEVRVYSRQLNDVTHAAPEIVAMTRGLPARRLVLDGETIVLDKDGKPLPFQVTMKRFGRKLEVASVRQSLPLTTQFFDCLLVDDEQLIDAPQAVRSAALAEQVDEPQVITTLASVDLAAGTAFLSRAFEQGYEGIMVKSLEARYEAGARGADWLKLKQAHTVDLVVLAAEWGSGRRRGKLSNLHLGAYDPSDGSFVMSGKTFKRLTDKLLAWQTEALLAREVARDDYVVYVRPELVVEIAFNDVQTSPHYPGGLALRFARVKRYREDKKPQQADTLETLRTLHNGCILAGLPHPIEHRYCAPLLHLF